MRVWFFRLAACARADRKMASHKNKAARSERTPDKRAEGRDMQHVSEPSETANYDLP